MLTARNITPRLFLTRPLDWSFLGDDRHCEMSSQEEDARDNLGIFPKWGEGLMFPKRGVGLVLSWAECVLSGGTTRPKGKLMQFGKISQIILFFS